ncbi:pectate lyase [Jonesia quinghaiensis]|uniref:pectate lyase n=1 Tax=Jonesia quinghaiensis TaxID=262806 RepID=UPI0003FAF78D|nr:pectate lyase [Jonesia quinghaiensis]
MERQASTASRFKRTMKAAWSAAFALAITGAVGVTVATPAQAASVDTNQWYVLENRQSGKVMEVADWSTADGGVIQQFTRNDGAWQQWRFKSVGSGWYVLENRHSGKVVDLWENKTADGTPFRQFTAHNGVNQQFKLADSNGGAHKRLINNASSKALTVTDRSKADFATVTALSDKNQFNQQWKLIPVSTSGSTGGSTDAGTGTGVADGNFASWPKASSQTKVSKTIPVPKSGFDGKMVRYYGISAGDQDENQPAMFELEDGATIKNVIIGDGAGDGIHCKGTCTIENVWWENVGEDAATHKGKESNHVMTVNGGGARSADDKVFQHNGSGKVVIKNFQVEDFGKLYRSCGNCSKQYARSVEISNILATGPALSIAGINSNLGDKATIKNVTIVNDPKKKIAICEEYNGVTKGEPKKISTGPSSACNYSASTVTYRN